MTDPARSVRRVLGDCIAVTAAFVIGVHEKQWPQLFEVSTSYTWWSCIASLLRLTHAVWTTPHIH